MKKVYIAHEFKGKKSNFQSISHICQSLAKFGIMPISPVHAFSFLNDNIPEQRSKALEFCENLVETCDAIFLCGDWRKSEGCILERDVALMEMIPIFEIVGWKDGEPVFKGEWPKWMTKNFKGPEHYREFHESRDELQELPNKF